MILTASTSSKVGATNVNAIASATAAFRQFMVYAATTISQAITGSVGLIKNGTGTLTLTGTNTYTEATTISAGTLTISGTGQLGGGSYAGNIANTGALIHVATTNQTLSGIMSGTGALTKSGTSTLTLNPGASSSVGIFTLTNGSVLLSSGTLSVTTNSGLRMGSSLAPTFTLNGGNLNTTSNAYIGGDFTGGRATFTLTSGTWTHTSSFISVQFGSSGNGSVMNVNGGLVDSPRIQLGQNAGTSTLNLNGGIVSVDSFFNTGSTSVLNLNGGTLRARTTSTNFLGFAGSFSVNVMTGGAIFDTNSLNLTVTVPLLSGTAGDGGLTKQSAGTLFLDGALSYLGPTNIVGGFLRAKKTVGASTATATFTGGGTSLSVVFDVSPPAAATTNFRFFQGTTTQTYGTITLTGVPVGTTATYTSATSTLAVTVP
jgi:autotransporter-associated beta strand protein